MEKLIYRVKQHGMYIGEIIANQDNKVFFRHYKKGSWISKLYDNVGALMDHLALFKNEKIVLEKRGRYEKVR